MTLDDELRESMSDAYFYGVAELDEYDPCWRERINPTILDMSENDYCILGQMFDGNLHKGMEELDIASLSSYGFDLSYEVGGLMDRLGSPIDIEMAAFSYLTELWRAEVERI